MEGFAEAQKILANFNEKMTYQAHNSVRRIFESGGGAQEIQKSWD